MLSNIWNKIRKWFKDSEVIFLARALTLYGFILAVFTGIDWTSLMSIDFSNGFDKKVLTASSFYIVQGIVIELARRHRATDL